MVLVSIFQTAVRLRHITVIDRLTLQEEFQHRPPLVIIDLGFQGILDDGLRQRGTALGGAFLFKTVDDLLLHRLRLILGQIIHRIVLLGLGHLIDVLSIDTGFLHISLQILVGDLSYSLAGELTGTVIAFLHVIETVLHLFLISSFKGVFQVFQFLVLLTHRLPVDTGAALSALTVFRILLTGRTTSLLNTFLLALAFLSIFSVLTATLAAFLTVFSARLSIGTISFLTILTALATLLTTFTSWLSTFLATLLTSLLTSLLTTFLSTLLTTLLTTLLATLLSAFLTFLTTLLTITVVAVKVTAVTHIIQGVIDGILQLLSL